MLLFKASPRTNLRKGDRELNVIKTDLDTLQRDAIEQNVNLEVLAPRIGAETPAELRRKQQVYVAQCRDVQFGLYPH